MLTQLTIHNFAIVKFLELELKSGMTTVTGETGAGKSIAIDALGLALGSRADASTVRPGEKKAEISAIFTVESSSLAYKWLTEHELNNEDECILRRVITAEGRSKGYINGVPVPLQQLKALSQFLVQVHGQHAHQTLLKPEIQLAILDGYASHTKLQTSVRDSYRNWHNLADEEKKLIQNQQQRAARQQLLQYQVSELNEFALADGEYSQIEAGHKLLANSTELVQECMTSLDTLYENEDNTICSMLQIVTQRLENLLDMDPKLKSITDTLQEAVVLAEEAGNELRSYTDNLDRDPEKFEYLDERLGKALELARKHQVPADQLATHHQMLKAELDNIAGDDERIESIKLELQESEAKYHQQATKLSSSRQKYAKQLNKLITASMHELSMENGCFEITLESSEHKTPNPQGLDNINFLVSTNPGQPLQALGKVASGGELSRISLAIQVITAQKISTPTLIFDEVDVGISGQTASIVGKLLRQLGNKTQVMCVTHLPQVASKGHQQMFVSKTTDGKTTETCMKPLSQEKRIEELARLLGGDKITASTLSNAAEMLV
ncbi:DNA repair protein RecN [Moritella viscosa]|uniref:DNA repair protein RecN n=1 Tax=Moritella viscosa TaxID=80854 RepID=A0ABY1HEK4_9GAMM|nr:DNA repair protein RecN [Moritella viscosa]SGY89842.1 DNA repair protein RecN [Moritella viscosa]SGY98418.1 DNA repair protein RecN [Moritella viscosa]SHO25900.1 DNA repair protein RecN [Moritella viscosa]